MTTATQTPCDMAIEILQRTNDGDDLAPSDLSLVEAAVNGWLTEAGEVAFYELHARTSAGEYQPPWFHDIEHLTRDHTGYVYWKGQRVEHYDSPWASSQAGKAEAVEVGRRCRYLESAGETVDTHQVIWRWEEDHAEKGGAA